MAKASIGIFPHKLEYLDNTTRPNTPDEVFEAALRVVDNKNIEIVRTQQGTYIVQYSETGPGSSSEGWSGWMPVAISRLQIWTAGGIKVSELEEYKKEQQDEEVDVAS